MTFNKIVFSDDKLLVKLMDEKREIFEPLTRKLGGVWNNELNGWLFDKKIEMRVDEFLLSQIETEIEENDNYSDYLAFGQTSKWNGNTPNSSRSEGNNDMYDIVQELMERVSELERITEDLSRKLKKK